MSVEEALSTVIDNLQEFVKSNKERTSQLEGERTCTRFLLERMHENLIKAIMKPIDCDQLNIMNSKIDTLMNIMNEQAQKLEKIEDMLNEN